MKKKVFVFAGVLCMTAMFMAGCGSQTPTANQESSGTNAQTQSSSVQSETVPESTAPQTESAEEAAPQTMQSTSENAEAAAKAAALKDAGVDEKDVLAISIHKDYDDGHEAYDVSIYTEDKDFDYTIDAASGAVLEKESEMVPKLTSESGDARIKAEDVKKIVFDKVPGAEDKNLRLSLEYDDGRLLYEGEIIYGNTDYDFEIDAQTGDILEWSEEKL